MFKIDKSGKGFPRIIVGRYRYRKDTILTNGDIRWRCLGKTCRASSRTDAGMTTLLSRKGDHTGDHPVAMSSLMTKSPSMSPPATGVAKKSLSAVDNFTSLTSSPLVSQSIITKTAYDAGCQTDQLCLRSTDELVARIEELTNRQSSLIERIQQLQQELDEMKENRALKQTAPHVHRNNAVSASTSTDHITHSTMSVQTDELTIPFTPCKTCPILKEETKNMLQAIRMMEGELQNKDGQREKECDPTEEVFTKYTFNLQTKNRFLPLECLGGENKQKPSPNRSRPRRRKNLKQMKNTASSLITTCKLRSEQVKYSKQLLLFTDSHGRTLSNLLSARVPATVSTFVNVQPGAPARCVVKSAMDSVDQLSSSDHLVLLAGTNDINVNSLNNGQHSIINHYEQLAGSTKHTNLIFCSIPKRHDVTSVAVRQAVEKINEKIYNISRQFKHVQYLNLEDSPRHWYTKHGLHFNKCGKKHLADSIVFSVLCKGLSVASDHEDCVGSTTYQQMPQQPSTDAVAQGQDVEDVVVQRQTVFALCKGMNSSEGTQHYKDNCHSRIPTPPVTLAHECFADAVKFNGCHQQSQRQTNPIQLSNDASFLGTPLASKGAN